MSLRKTLYLQLLTRKTMNHPGMTGKNVDREVRHQQKTNKATLQTLNGKSVSFIWTRPVPIQLKVDHLLLTERGR